MSDDSLSNNQLLITIVGGIITACITAVIGPSVVELIKSRLPSTTQAPTPSTTQAPIQSPPPSPSPAQISIKPLDKPGLYLASTTLVYSDGDQLKADFRVYCPTSTIRPTNYVFAVLVDRAGTVKKQGAWWEQAFTPKYDAEHQLIKEVCTEQ